MRLHFYDPPVDGEIKVFSQINPESEAIRDLKYLKFWVHPDNALVNINSLNI